MLHCLILLVSWKSEVSNENLFVIESRKLYLNKTHRNWHWNRILDPPPKSAGLLAQLTARITPNKTPAQAQSQQQVQPQPQNNDYDRSRNEPIYQQRRGSNQSSQYSNYDSQSIYGQQQTDGKNQIYSQSPHHQPFQQQQHQYNVYNQNIYVSTNPFISTPSNNFSSSSFGKDVTGNYPSKASPKQTFSF